MTITIREVLLERSTDDHPALLTVNGQWTWREYVAESARRAHALAGLLDPQQLPHVGVLMDNTTELGFLLGAAGLGGQVLVGLNHTRRGAALAADVAKADTQLLLVDPQHLPLLEQAGIDLPVLTTDSTEWRERVAAAPTTLPETAPAPDTLFMLVFTSGTSGDPKAVRVTHHKITFPGNYLNERLGIGRDDVHYVSMPLFHSNGLMAGWAPALMSGATVALAEKFSATRFLDDARRYGATYANYVGKPLAYILATPERPDDADNPLRLVFGNEAGDRDSADFARRFGCTVIDGFGSSENAVVISRIPGTPPGSLGQPLPDVAILDPETGQECPRAVYDDRGQVTNLEECVGELVNVEGAGQFAGYYKDDEATAERMRDGMYWSGDLAYRDADGWVYYAGRTADWLRVDGENLAAAPIERILMRHPSVSEAAVYAVPDPQAGDQLVAALVLTAEISPQEWERFLADQADLGTKSWPRFVRILGALPHTVTNKVLKRELTSAGIPGLAADEADPTTDPGDGPDSGWIGDRVWERDERGTAYRPIP